MNYKNFLKDSTNLIIAITVVCYAIQCLFTFGSTSSSSIYNAGGLWGANLLSSGEFYRLISPIFIHIGIFHLLFNLAALKSVGPIVDGTYGRSKFFLAYILCGIGGNIFAAILTPNAVVAGASGAIFGLFGLVYGLGKSSNNSMLKGLSASFGSVIAMNLLLNVVTPGVSMAGHVGGAITGYLLSKLIKTEYI